MRKAFLPLLATLFLIILAALLIPLFVSTDLLKEQIEKTVKDQTGMSLDIGGDVSFSLLTGFKLSVEEVGLRDASDKPLFSVDRLDFGLALMPLLSGKADISAVILRKPVFTLQNSKTPNSSQNSAANQSTPSSSDNQDIDLSALSLRRLEIQDGRLLSIDDEEGIETELIGDLNAQISIPDFNGAASLAGSLQFKGKIQNFSGTLGQVANAINGKASPLTLDLSSDVYKARLEATLEHKGAYILVANYALNAGSVSNLLSWFDAPDTGLGVQKLALQGSLALTKEEAQIRSLSVNLDDQTIDLATRVYFAPTLERPLVRIAIDTANLNLDKLLKSGNKAEVQTTSQQQPASTQKSQTSPDLSALSSFDATLDLRGDRLSTNGIEVRNIKLLASLQDGSLSTHLKSANLAKGSLEARLDGSTSDQIWQGFVTAKGLGLDALAAMAGQTSPATGILGANIDFAARGLTAQSLQNSSNIAGTINLSKGSFSHPALQQAVAGRDSGTLSNINGTLTLEGLDKPARLNGSLGWNGETIRYDSQLGLAEALAGTPIPASFSADARPLAINLSGSFNPAKISLNGSRLSVKSSSSRALLQWLGNEVTSGTPDVPIDLKTRLSFDQSRTSLTDLALTMGQSKGTGSIIVATAGKPNIDANIAFEKLDVTPFMGDGQAQGRTGNQASTAKKASKGWDQSPIDFSGLDAIDANIAFATQSLIARDIVTGPVQIKAKLQNGNLVTSLDNLTLYGGRGTGGVSVNGRAQPANIEANFALQNLQMQNFLRDTTSLGSLSGTGGVTIALKTTGHSQAELVSNLNGTSNLDIRDGQIRGINIPQMLRSLKGNILEGWASSEAQSTDFSALTASFNITNGIARNDDLTMASPLLRMTGAGFIDLPQQHIDYKVTPKLISKLKGQGGPLDANGVPIPIIIKGKLDKPRIYPDIPGILQNPQAILQSLNNLGGPGKAAAEKLQKLDKNLNDAVSNEIQKQSEKLGIDLNQILQPNQNNNQNNGQGQQQGQPTQQPRPEQQLLNDLTKGLFGN